MEKVNDIKKEDLIELGFKRIDKDGIEYEYIYKNNRLLYAYIHDVIVDTFSVSFSIGRLDMSIDSKYDLKRIIDVTTRNITQSWIDVTTGNTTQSWII